MISKIENWLLSSGVSENMANYMAISLIIVAIIIIAIISHYITRRIMITAVTFLVRKSKTKWDDALLEHHTFSRLSHLVPAIIIYLSAPLFGSAQVFLERLSQIYMALAGLLVFNALLSAIVTIYREYDISRSRPIKGYIQIIKVVMAVAVMIIIISTLLGKSPLLLLSGLGAMTAVILLVFKDSILGLVASIQLSGNDMVQIGDWIEMPKYGADGDVVDITLNTVKIQNWDKTISTIPAYYLISDSFKNWRGMSESGGRRIKRSVSIDMNSVKFCTSEMLNRYEKFELLAGYVKAKRKEIAVYNAEHNIDTSELINGRNLTNLGTFRAYLVSYLKAHPKIHNEMTFLVRHLPPGEKGLPIEIYVFSNDQEWANYEAIQADIFDHILAVLPLFNLNVFQQPTGRDFNKLLNR